MKRIGLDRSSGDIYENMGNIWRAIWPSPLISQAVLDPEFPAESFAPTDCPKCIFREDAFDPVARVRRGRLYVLAGSPQPSQSYALPHPAGEYFNARRRGDGLFERFLYYYDQYQLPANIPPPKFLAIGAAESIWQVLFRPECISTGDLLFVLKARHAFGILPEVNAAAIPERGRGKVIETLEALTDVAHRESPGSIIDRATHAVQCSLATWAAAKFDDNSLLTKYLDDLIKAVQKKKTHVIATDAANIVRVLHARGKPNAQERHGTRPVMEDDSELALRAVSFLIREFGWVREF